MFCPECALSPSCTPLSEIYLLQVSLLEGLSRCGELCVASLCEVSVSQMLTRSMGPCVALAKGKKNAFSSTKDS